MRRNGLVLTLVFGLLAGCGGGGLHLPKDVGAHASPSIRVLSRSFTVAGPQGFCVDREATQKHTDSAFVVFGSCAAVSGNPEDKRANAPAVLTAAVVPVDGTLVEADFEAMVRYLKTPDGSALLARDGGKPELLAARQDGTALHLRARDAGGRGGQSARYWRRIFTAGGALVTVTVSGFRSSPLSDSEGEALVQAFAESILKANPETDGKPAKYSGNPIRKLLDRLP